MEDVTAPESAQDAETVARFAYADPPYLGQAMKHYGKHEDYAGEVDHAELIERMCGDDNDGEADA